LVLVDVSQPKKNNEIKKAKKIVNFELKAIAFFYCIENPPKKFASLLFVKLRILLRRMKPKNRLANFFIEILNIF